MICLGVLLIHSRLKAFSLTPAPLYSPDFSPKALRLILLDRSVVPPTHFPLLSLFFSLLVMIRRTCSCSVFQVLDALGEAIPCASYDSWMVYLPEAEFLSRIGPTEFYKVESCFELYMFHYFNLNLALSYAGLLLLTYPSGILR